MTNYLIRHINDPRQNERYEIVSAESKEDVLSWYKEHKERMDWKSIDRKDSE